MTESIVMTIGRDALLTALMIAAPLLAVSLVVGMVVSLFQAVTQISEMTLTFVPKLIGLGLAMLILGPWMLQQVVRFTVRLFEILPQMVR
jgi:flagellar biosynthetic protein FliQ